MHGKSHGIFTSPPPPPPYSNSVSPHLTIEPLPSVAYPVISSLEPSKNGKGRFAVSPPGKRLRTAASESRLAIRWATDLHQNDVTQKII